MKAGKAIIISGPSGVGKGTLVRRLLARNPSLHLSVSATTRAPRAGEIHGRDYFFLSREQFEEEIQNDRMLEYAEYVGNYYGTPADAVSRHLAAGDSVILEIELNGALQVLEKLPDTVSIFVLSPDRETLIARLRGRGTEDEGVIKRRIDRALQELKSAEKYRYRVINDDIDRAVSEIEDILRREL